MALLIGPCPCTPLCAKAWTALSSCGWALCRESPACPPAVEGVSPLWDVHTPEQSMASCHEKDESGK